MSGNISIKTKISDVADYWASRVAEYGLSVDWAEARIHCWRCGCESNLERCHIVPAALGGKDEPSNLVLLCKRCHADGPNVTDPQIMWDWIRAYGVPFYGTFWSIMGFKEYKFVCERSIKEEVNDIIKAAGVNVGDEVYKKFLEFVNEMMGESNIHFGQDYLNVSTMAGIYRMALKKLAEYYDVDFSFSNGKKFEIRPWWADYLI